MNNLHVCLESNGHYGYVIAEFLYPKGIEVSIVNPCLMKNFALSFGKRNKTDAIDCEVNQPSIWEPPSESVKALIELTRTTDDLKKQRQALNNRLEGRTNKTVEKSLKEIIKYLDEQIKLLEKKTSEIVSEDDNLNEQKKIMVSVDGLENKQLKSFCQKRKENPQNFIYQEL